MSIQSEARVLILEAAGLLASNAERAALSGLGPVFLPMDSGRVENLTSSAFLELTYNNIVLVPDYCNVSSTTIMLWQKSNYNTARGVLHSEPITIDVLQGRTWYDALYLVPHVLIYLFAIYCQYKYR